jgi:MFS transporter, SP family, sugar:H+ symporter
VLLCCAGSVLQASSFHWVQLMLGAIIIGGGVPFLLMAAYVVSSELAPAPWRASFIGSVGVGNAAALWFALTTSNVSTVMGFGAGWRLFVAMSAWPAVVLFILVVWMPDTPNSLVQRGQLAEARDVLGHVRGPFHDLDQELVDIWHAAGSTPSGQETSQVLAMTRGSCTHA